MNPQKETIKTGRAVGKSTTPVLPTPTAGPSGRFAMYKKTGPTPEHQKVLTADSIRQKVTEGVIVPGKLSRDNQALEARAAQLKQSAPQLRERDRALKQKARLRKAKEKENKRKSGRKK